MSTNSLAPQCPNCEAPLLHLQPPPAHCPRCGQATRLHAPTFFEFIHEFVGHYVALEGALWRTLGNLFFRPGRLTTEYVAGRRRKYVLPLRLYITASFLFFLVVKVFDTDSGLRLTIEAPEPAASTAASAASGAAARPVEMPPCLKEPERCNFAERLAAKAEHEAERPDGLKRKFGPEMDRQMLSMAPYAALAMQPLFAGLMQWVYRNRRKPYGEHFLFSLHMHAFWFLALLVLNWVPSGWDDALLLLLVPHGLLAMRQVYGGRWWTTALRWLAASTAYGMALALTTIGLIVSLALL
jgi:Protein of unknown function (DUF3667)